MEVSIVIPTWNGKDKLAKNIPSVLAALDNKANNIQEIIVVDDGSNDDTVAFIKKTYGSSIRLIKHRVNRGFSSAVNTGVRMSKGQLVCLLNNDVLPSKNFLVSPVKQFRDTKVFAVCLHESGAGNAIGSFKNGFFEHRGGPEANVIQDTMWANGGSSLYSRKKFMKLKGMDEMYAPFYWEDIDLSYRAAKRGYKVLWDPDASVEHKHESTINTDNFKKKYMDRVKERNQLLFVWKNITSPRLFRKHIKGLLARILKHPGYIKVVIAALGKRKEVVKARKIETKECKVSDEAIFAKFS